jgi:uncharacterized repeat protein (TIGR01451 family)
MRTLCVLRLNSWVIATALITSVIIPDLSATHFRFGHLNWEPTATAGEVEFHLVNAFRRTAYPGTFADGFPQTGDIITESLGATSLFFGDGTTTPTLHYRVIAFSTNENWIVGEALHPGTTASGLRHIYSGAGPYVNVGIDSCCRFSTLNNRPDGNYILSTRVTPRDGNRSPVSSLVPIVIVPSSSSAKFPVPAVDPDGDRLRWRLATVGEAGGGAHPPNLSVDANTGEVTWNNLGLNASNPWTTQIVIEDLDSAGNVKSKTPVDFFLRISTTLGTDPDARISPPPPFEVDANAPMSFTITGTDADPGSTVTINSGGLPLGATTSPSLPTTGPSGVQATFNWTPTEPGTHQIVFSVTDNAGKQRLVPVSITVRAVADLSLTKVATPEPVKVTSNLTYSIIVSNNGPSEASAVSLSDTLPAGVTFVSASSSQGSCTQSVGIVTCSLGNLVTGAGASVTIIVTPTVEGSITNYARVISSSSDPNHADNEATVVSTVEPLNEAPMADASASEVMVISGNNVDATVRLDGSRSSDPDGDALMYYWFEGGEPLANEVAPDVTLTIGLHAIDLTVFDGLESDTDTIEVVVLSLCDAINLLKIKIDESNLGRKNKRPLFTTIEAGCQSFDAGEFETGVNQLKAFQNKVRAQVRPSDPVAAQCFDDLAQDIIDAVQGD